MRDKLATEMSRSEPAQHPEINDEKPALKFSKAFSSAHVGKLGIAQSDRSYASTACG
jgi:hypothetical protein